MCSPSENFVPEKFTVLDFYGHESCFLWSADKLIIIQYPVITDSQNPHASLTAPGIVKDVQCCNNKVYVLCRPSGIYKLSQKYTFSRISATGVGIVKNFEIITPCKDILCLVNKANHKVKQLCYVSPDIKDLSSICLFHVYANKTDKNFLKALVTEVADCCLIINGKVIYRLVNEKIHVIYAGDYIIADIVAIYKLTQVFSLAFLTKKNVAILMYEEADKLKFEKVHLPSHSQAFCACISKHTKDAICIIYSDNVKTYHLLKKLDNDYMQVLSHDDQTFLCLKIYEGKELLCLPDNAANSDWLIKVSLDTLEEPEIKSTEDTELITLHASMLEGIEDLLDTISEKANILKEKNAELDKLQDTIKRVNMYTIKRRIQFIPKVNVCRLLDHIILTVDFQRHLPQNSQVILSVKLEDTWISCIKDVGKETKIQLPIPFDKITSKACIKIDSIIVRTEAGPWCLIKDFVKDPVQKKDDNPVLDKKKLNFLHSKLSALKILIEDQKIDMQNLQDMKKSIRQELPTV